MFFLMFACGVSEQPTPTPTPTVSAPAFKSPDEKADWAGLKWGDPPPKDAKCKTVDTIEQICNRGNVDDDLLGGVTPKSVSYFFYENRLYETVFSISALDEPKVFQGLQSVYGPTSGVGSIAAWRGEKVHILLSKGMLMYIYNPIHNEFQAAKKAMQSSEADKLKNSL